MTFVRTVKPRFAAVVENIKVKASYENSIIIPSVWIPVTSRLSGAFFTWYIGYCAQKSANSSLSTERSVSSPLTIHVVSTRLVSVITIWWNERKIKIGVSRYRTSVQLRKLFVYLFLFAIYKIMFTARKKVKTAVQFCACIIVYFFEFWQNRILKHIILCSHLLGLLEVSHQLLRRW